MAIPGAKKVTFILLNLILPSICWRGNALFSYYSYARSYAWSLQSLKKPNPHIALLTAPAFGLSS